MSLVHQGLALVLLAGPLVARGEAPTLAPVTVQGRTQDSPVDVGGFAGRPARELPMQTTVIGEGQRLDLGFTDLGDFSRVDASVGAAYNATGYWSNLTVRGFSLDLRSNLRRDGLPISGETALPLDNKARLELLKGTSGMQAGVSAPGGLLNLVVKRPDVDLRSGLIEFRQGGNVLTAVDWSSRFGEARRFGLRVNAAVERLRPALRDAEGRRQLMAAAADWRVSPDSLLEAEVEWSGQRQASQPGFSLLGDRLPSAREIDPRINLNNQPWTDPVDFEALTGSLRWTQRLTGGWEAVAHAGAQRLKTDDRTAFPFGCSAEGRFDRYCSDGSFDLYDYRSDHERRRTEALDLSLRGSLQTGPVQHRLSTGVLLSRSRADFEPQAYNFVGTGRIDGEAVVPEDPARVFDNTHRRERSTEVYLRDAMALTPDLTLWLGLRQTQLRRSSITTSGTEATAYRQDFTSPWLAASWQPAPGQTVYASWGRGVESDVTPNRPRYAGRGQALRPLESRQRELGWRGGAADLQAGLALFRIERPVFADLGACDDDMPGSCRRAPDGDAVHTGLEASLDAQRGDWTFGLGATWLRARREGSADPAVNGSRPVNVPERSLRASAQVRVPAVPGLRLLGLLRVDGDRVLLPGSDAPRLPGWASFDLAARLDQTRPDGTRLRWRLGLDNVFDRRAWQEGPFQFGHVYLYPLAPRTLRLSLQADL